MPKFGAHNQAVFITSENFLMALQSAGWIMNEEPASWSRKSIAVLLCMTCAVTTTLRAERSLRQLPVNFRLVTEVRTC